MKTCPECLKNKRESSFQKNKAAPDGLQYHCKQCRKAIDSRPEHRKQHRERYHRNKRRLKTLELQRTYGISVEQFEEMLKAQGNKCLICKRTSSGGNGWHVDHSHKLKRVRGILCCYCNPMLGFAQDNPHILLAAVDYLQRKFS